MTNNNQVEKGMNFNSVPLILFFWKWRKLLVIITSSAAIISLIVSLLITPKFQSKVVMFPTSSNSISKALISTSFGLKQDIMEFGEEEQAEQLLQVLHSSIIRDRIIEKYDLYTHYEIPETAKFRRTKMTKMYNSNIQFSRTKFMAVEISVMDKDPQMAADIANDISELLDTLMNQMQKERSLKAFHIVEKTYNDLLKNVSDMEDTLAFLRSKGVFDYESQSERLFEALSKEVAKGNKQGIAAFEDQLNTLAVYGGRYVSIRDALDHDKKQLSEIKLKYEEAKIDAEEVLPHKFIVDRAYKSEKKVYPIKSLIVIISTLTTFLLAIVAIIIYENFKLQIKSQNHEE